MLRPDPPGVSSKPFSRPQKLPRLNVTLADRCTAARKWTEAAFLRRKLQKLAALGPACLPFVRENKQWVTHWEVLLLPDKRFWQEEKTAAWGRVKTVLLLHCCGRTCFKVNCFPAQNENVL